MSPAQSNIGGLQHGVANRRQCDHSTAFENSQGAIGSHLTHLVAGVSEEVHDLGQRLRNDGSSQEVLI